MTYLILYFIVAKQFRSLKKCKKLRDMVPVGYYIIFTAVGSVATVCTLLFFVECLITKMVLDDEADNISEWVSNTYSYVVWY